MLRPKPRRLRLAFARCGLMFAGGRPALSRPPFHPHSAPLPDERLAERAARLNTRFAAAPAEEIVEFALCETFGGRAAVATSFGAESVVLLDLAARADRHAAILFLDTGNHFAATLDYMRTVIEHLRLTNVRIVTPDSREVADEDPANDLHRRDPDACCDLRKIRPLKRALADYDAWLSGRKRRQSRTRARLPIFEANDTHIIVSPLAGWPPEAVGEYIARCTLPVHPLVAKGYRSIGCRPCTTPVEPGEDPRAGRWRAADKTECGIHERNRSSS